MVMWAMGRQLLIKKILIQRIKALSWQKDLTKYGENSEYTIINLKYIWNIFFSKTSDLRGEKALTQQRKSEKHKTAQIFFCLLWKTIIYLLCKISIGNLVR